mmetsp:Transcript_10181/g.42231  ORF Transcript_10181/g.42231 Transcript_10181/m.42231 type:complete len:230 (+) Transcript_10181:901-1590(+)
MRTRARSRRTLRLRSQRWCTRMVRQCACFTDRPRPSRPTQRDRMQRRRRSSAASVTRGKGRRSHSACSVPVASTLGTGTSGGPPRRAGSCFAPAASATPARARRRSARHRVSLWSAAEQGSIHAPTQGAVWWMASPPAPCGCHSAICRRLRTPTRRLSASAVSSAKARAPPPMRKPPLSLPLAEPPRPLRGRLLRLRSCRVTKAPTAKRRGAMVLRRWGSPSPRSSCTQ